MSTINSSKPEAYVTLVATDSYVKGAIVLAYSIRNIGTTKLLICLVTPGLEKDSLVQLHRVFDHVLPISKLDTHDVEKLTLLGRTELGLTVSKIHIWSLDWIETALFLDADTLVLKSIDHLFEKYRDIPFAACPDPGWPDCFNSGVFLCKPNRETYQDLLNLLATEGSFDGGDQGLLNTYFGKWSQTADQRMPYIYNVMPNAVYSYAPAYQKNSDNIAVMHFIGKDKPWNSEPLLVSATQELVKDLDPGCVAPDIRLKPKTLKDDHPLKVHSETPIPVKLDHRTYLDKWWEIYRTNISGLTDDLNSLTLQNTEHSSLVPDLPDIAPPERLSPKQEQATKPIMESSTPDARPHYSYYGNNTFQSNAGYQTYAGDAHEAFSARYSFDTAYQTIPTSRYEYTRPILPETALNNLSDRNMLTSAHQQASEHNKPFPLFEEYLRPKSQHLRTTEASGHYYKNETGLGYNFPSSSLDQNTSSRDSNMLAQGAYGSPANVAAQASPPSSKGTDSWKPIPIEFLSGQGDETQNEDHSDSAVMDLQSVLSDSVKIQHGVPWEAKLTCTSSKPRSTTSGEFQTTYTLLWEENLISANSSMAASPRLGSTPAIRVPKTGQSQQKNDPHPADYMSLYNTPRFVSPNPASPVSEELPQEVQKMDSSLKNPSFSNDPSTNAGFGAYRVQWDQPELQGWTAPNMASGKAKYQDAEVPYKMR
ncbi:glycogenin glucosyltransferase [Entomophthora muscae]|uniref:Glycogenin glucosyltransferase n=1 Tax=Entomophthora muscae TaxID=34485 RepID=A0ACC2T2P0_9FUNG|nr:glycogenin glucosyltransferase [Entomophthora muscae]